MSVEQNDYVEVSISRCVHGSRNRPTVLGTFKGYVHSVFGGEVCVTPDNWDEVCDLLGIEGSMSWTEIRDLRKTNMLDALPIEDVKVLRKDRAKFKVVVEIEAPADTPIAELERLFLVADYTLLEIHVQKVEE